MSMTSPLTSARRTSWASAAIATMIKKRLLAIGNLRHRPPYGIKADIMPPPRQFHGRRPGCSMLAHDRANGLIVGKDLPQRDLAVSDDGAPRRRSLPEVLFLHLAVLGERALRRAEHRDLSAIRENLRMRNGIIRNHFEVARPCLAQVFQAGHLISKGINEG